MKVKRITAGQCRILVILILVLALLPGCTSWLPASGPSGARILEADPAGGSTGIQVVEVNDQVARRLLQARNQQLFSETLQSPESTGYVVGRGDVLEVSVWEAPPATLFGASTAYLRGGLETAHANTLPEQMVSAEGTINIPFAGPIVAAGRTLPEVEAAIVRSLKGKANQPQVMVRLLRNVSANVTVVGEVAASTLVPLTPRGERLLDALAAAGGVRQPVTKVSLQITRGDQVQTLPLNTVIRDPKQNIRLQPGDVLTALHQPYSFSVLGASGKNQEIDFEAQGISLAQALARAAGLQDARADARGVFIFRFEAVDALDWETPPVTTPEGKVPVVYRADLKDPATFFVAQSFPIQDRDVLYVSNAPAAEFQKFLNIIMSTAFPILNFSNGINQLTK